MPPAPIRRPVTITVWLVVSLIALVLSPLILAVATLVSAMLRRPQARLLARFLIAYFARELAVLVACGGLWVLAGFGLRMQSERSQQRHYRLLHWFLHGLAVRAVELLDIDVDPGPSEAAAAALAADRPLLFFSRHAGPGDTVLLIDMLLHRYERLPSVVFRQELVIDPCVDLIGHRLPHVVLDADDRERCEERIEEVAGALSPRGVLVLFPEGGNFTPQRRRRALRKLRRKGRSGEAAAGAQMKHVMPPHPTGALAALRGNPSADVLFSAHTGLGLAAFPRQLWRHTPIGRTLRTHMWLVPAGERPPEPEEQVRWLYDWWKRIDAWVDSQGEEPGAGAA